MANNPADTPPDVQMSAADVAYVVAWEKQTGIKLNLPFNAIGACTGAVDGRESAASVHRLGHRESGERTFTDPGQRRHRATPTTPPS